MHSWFWKNPCIHLEPCKDARHCLDKAITLIKCHVENIENRPDLAKPLPRLALAPFHGEVMKQQVWTARSTWVDKPRKSAVTLRACEAPVNYYLFNYFPQKQSGHTVLTFHDSFVQPLNACLWKWPTTLCLQNKQARKSPRSSLPTITEALQHGEQSESPFTREKAWPSRDTKPQILMTCFIRTSRVCTKD